MTEARYKNLMEFLSSRRIYVTAINLSDRIITAIVALSYFFGIIYAFATKSDRLIPMIVVPAISFVFVSLFRSFYDALRPYEVYSTLPVLKKDKAGKSLPSRHIFSIFVIAMALMGVLRPLGIFVIVLGFIQAFIRVIGGVHFIRDVIVGALVGLLCGYAGIYLIF